MAFVGSRWSWLMLLSLFLLVVLLSCSLALFLVRTIPTFANETPFGPFALTHSLSFSFSYFRNALFHFCSHATIVFIHIFHLLFFHSAFLFTNSKSKIQNPNGRVDFSLFFLSLSASLSICCSSLSDAVPICIWLCFVFFHVRFSIVRCNYSFSKYSFQKLFANYFFFVPLLFPFNSNANLVHEIPSHSKIGHYTTQNQHEQASISSSVWKEKNK